MHCQESGQCVCSTVESSGMAKYQGRSRPGTVNVKRRILLWFIVYGLVVDELCTADAVKNPDVAKTSNSLSSEGSGTAGKTSDVDATHNVPKIQDTRKRAIPSTKTPAESSSENTLKSDEDYVMKVPLSLLWQLEMHQAHAMRGRDSPEKRNTIIPVPRFGRSSEEEANEWHDYAENNNEIRRSSSDSVIPYPRLGRFISSHNEDESAEEASDNYGSKEVEMADMFAGRNEYDQNSLNDVSNANSMYDRNMEDYETMISYPNVITEDGLLDKRSAPDYIVPQIRYGRSMLLLSPPKMEETTKQKPAQTFVLPYPRPGRSSGYDSLIPFPRPGRSGKLDDSSLDSLFQPEEISEGAWGSKSNLLLTKMQQKSLSDISSDKSESGSSFVIPYPRPGKRFTAKMAKQKPNTLEKETSDYVLPYPRPGKKSGKQKAKFGDKMSKVKENADVQNFVLPYPRPGRASENTLEISYANDFADVLGNTFVEGDGNKIGIATESYDEPDSVSMILETDPEENFRFKRSTAVFLHPPIKINDSILSNQKLKRSTAVTPAISSGNLERSDFVVQYPKLKSDSTRSRRSVSVVPYPRIGRSDSVVPYPRLGRSVSVVPYPRPGRSDSVVPYPRLGRSGSVVPYPRPGRSESVVPYPRLGRSGSLVPYPRPGRSESVVPYLRLGRSGAVVPYPRPGRSVVPYPRLGRSGLVPYPRPGRSDFIVPRPRLGRSDSLKSSQLDSMIPYLRPGRSDSIVPYPRPGRSDSEISHLRQRRSINAKEIETDKYPATDNHMLFTVKPERSDGDSHVIQNLRYDMSPFELSKQTYTAHSRRDRSTHSQGYVLPHPRIGRLDPNHSFTINDDRLRDDSLTAIPYLRFGRTQKQTIPSPPNSIHKLNKHMLPKTDESVYILPYPRPGRSS